MHRPVLVVTTQFLDDVEARINRDYDAQRSPDGKPLTRDGLIEASSGPAGRSAEAKRADPI
jgi:hypothetical protein